MRVVTGLGPGRLDLAPDAVHGAAEVAIAALVLGPARRINARPPMKRVDAQAAVVGQRGEPARSAACARLQLGIVDEGVAGLLGLGQVELGRADPLDAVGREQVADLADLARDCGWR